MRRASPPVLAGLFFLWVALATILGCGTTPTVTPSVDAAPQTDVRVEASPEVGTSLVCVANDAADCAGQCGEILNRCGNVVDCGGCDLGQVCGAGGPNHCGVGTCTPSCVGRSCGSDGCAALCGMGGCGLGQACVGGACHCDPVVCQGCCGTDGSCQACDCGGNGKPCCAGSTCTGSLTCASGTCGGCQPSCAGAACGDGDGCGGKCTADCPTCNASSCPDGCCNGVFCDKTESSGACGLAGNTCVSCFAIGESCVSGQCGAACGGPGDNCCVSGSPCVPGEGCSGGKCQPCGTLGSACCPNQMCTTGTCGQDKHCDVADAGGACGDAGFPCCPSAPQCGPNLQCSGPSCTSCGVAGQSCCSPPAAECSSGSFCNGSTCSACGGLTQACCPTGLQCTVGVCNSSNMCEFPSVPDAGMDSSQPDSGGGFDSSPLDSGTLPDSTLGWDSNPPDSAIPPPIDSGPTDSNQLDTNPPFDSNLPDNNPLDSNLPPVDVTSPDGGACFVAGTPVAMANGLSIRIETVKEGDLVRSYDPSAHRVVSARVLERIEHGASASAGGLVLINGTLLATREHPFFVNGAPVRADALEEGTPLLILSEHSVVQTRPVRTVQLVSGGVETFELRVSGSGLYFVDSTLAMMKEAGAP